MELSKVELAQMIDHTLLKPESKTEDILRICQEAKKFGGFPLGAATSEVKRFEANNALDNGAEELDMVINIGALKSADFNRVLQDIKGVVEVAKGNLVKVIIETCYLSNEEKVKACQLAKEAGAHFVKTSTGFGSGGATIEDVQLMRKTVGDFMGVKAAGGIRTYDDALRMIQAGANRLGASAGITIIEEHPKD